MGCFPASSSGLNYKTYPVGPTASETALSTPGANNTKGSWTQIIASADFETNGVFIDITFVGVSGSRQFLVDLGIGASLSEVVKVPDLLCECSLTTTSFSGCSYYLPWKIPAGSRVAGRFATNSITSSPSVEIAITLIKAGDIPGIESFTTYGADTSDSGGLQIDPGGSANTKGSYSELTSGTAAVTQFLMLMASMKGNTAASSGRWLIDLSLGPATETVLVPDQRFAVGLNNNHISPRMKSFATYIAASTRITARASSNITDATDRLIDVAIMTGTVSGDLSGGSQLVGGGLVS